MGVRLFRSSFFAYSIGKGSSSKIDRADAQENVFLDIAQSSVTRTQELTLVYPPDNSLKLQLTSQALCVFTLWFNN
jgi:hypothetical protein